MCELSPEAKRYIVRVSHQLFRAAADEDYIAARLASRFALPQAFAWNAQQALEKYLKCALLCNFQSVKVSKRRKSSHDLSERYNRLMPLVDELFDQRFHNLPETVFPHSRSALKSETPAEFIKLIETEGTPSNRYRENDLSLTSDDLHKFDFMATLLRSFCISLDEPSSINNLKMTNREAYIDGIISARRQKFQFDININSEISKQRNEALCWNNYALDNSDLMIGSNDHAWSFNRAAYIHVTAFNKEGYTFLKENAQVPTIQHEA